MNNRHAKVLKNLAIFWWFFLLSGAIIMFAYAGYVNAHFYDWSYTAKQSAAYLEFIVGHPISMMPQNVVYVYNVAAGLDNLGTILLACFGILWLTYDIYCLVNYDKINRCLVSFILGMLIPGLIDFFNWQKIWYVFKQNHKASDDIKFCLMSDELDQSLKQEVLDKEETAILASNNPENQIAGEEIIDENLQSDPYLIQGYEYNNLSQELNDLETQEMLEDDPLIDDYSYQPEAEVIADQELLEEEAEAELLEDQELMNSEEDWNQDEYIDDTKDFTNNRY